jgi:trans-aconitate 2-methyltransferase
MTDRYTFGDNPRAGDRLELLAAVFEPSSAELLGRAAPAKPARALDLGCGPGYTTDLLRRVVGSGETWGLDASTALVERARSRFTPPCLFAIYDVSKRPLPVAQMDVAYARYVLTHLRDPGAAIAACAGAVRRGGYLVLEENCALFSDDPLFADYYRCVEALQRHYGQDPYPGDRLASLALRASWTVESFERTRLQLDARPMAQLHALNIRTWGKDPFAVSSFGPSALATMTDALDAVVRGEVPAPAVTCVMGQAILRR